MVSARSSRHGVRSLQIGIGGSCIAVISVILMASTCNCDLSNYLQYEVLGQQVGWHLAVQYETDAGRNLDEQLASSQNETSICVANARGKLTKGASIASVGICPKHDLTCAGNSTSYKPYTLRGPCTWHSVTAKAYDSQDGQASFWGQFVMSRSEVLPHQCRRLRQGLWQAAQQ